MDLAVSFWDVFFGERLIDRYNSRDWDSVGSWFETQVIAQFIGLNSEDALLESA